jgi:ribosomal protein S18 acetylase RimI-like enzyme
MQPVTSFQLFDECLRKVKAGARQFTTNLFPSREKIAAWVESGQLFFSEAPGTLWVFRKNSDLFHLFFASADPDSLEASMNRSDVFCDATMVVDVIGKPAGAVVMASRFAAVGFERIASLERMAMLRSAVELKNDLTSKVADAVPNDVESILDLLQSNFDKYVDQLPGRDDVKATIEKRNILTLRIGDRIAGFLYFEITGYSAVVRYWFVDSAFRDRGTGSLLIRAFLDRCMGVTRVLLWVNSTNRNAIEKYRHYGFVRENLVDYVMIKRGQLP